MDLRTAEELVADVRSRAGMEGSDDDFVTDPEVLGYLNEEILELRGHMRMSEGHPHKALSTSISVSSGTSEYILPGTFWELLGVVATIGGRTVPLDSFMENERAGLTNSPTIGTGYAPRYRIHDNVIEFLPVVQDMTVTLRYAPAEGRLRLGQVPPDKSDGYNGYLIAAVYGAVATCLAKEERDPSFYEGRKARMIAHIKALAAQRDASRPERVTDVTGGLYDEFSR